MSDVALAPGNVPTLERPRWWTLARALMAAGIVVAIVSAIAVLVGWVPGALLGRLTGLGNSSWPPFAGGSFESDLGNLGAVLMLSLPLGVLTRWCLEDGSAFWCCVAMTLAVALSTLGDTESPSMATLIMGVIALRYIAFHGDGSVRRSPLPARDARVRAAGCGLMLIATAAFVGRAWAEPLNSPTRSPPTRSSAAPTSTGSTRRDAFRSGWSTRVRDRW